MIENKPSSVMVAFEILLEEIDAEIEFVNRVGEHAFEDRDYDKTKKAIERAAQITSFRDKVNGLRFEWKSLFGSKVDKEEVTEAHTKRSNLGHIRRGLRTPEEAYYRPILEALQELGGSAKTSQVLDIVFQKMKSVLQEVDYGPLASDPEIPRWRNTAQWARYSMIEEGLLQSNSPRGVWAISDKGIHFISGNSD